MKKTSYIFLFFLFIVLIFILGVRYGQKVEKNNKVVDYLLSVTPTPKPPTPAPIKYTEYKSKKWGLKFTYPENLKIKESTAASEVLFEIKEDENKDNDQ
jgi:hypothetical protein